ncbi:MAG: hypothetical protein O3C69_02275 [Chloroflexi bacterium]|nr:hypothetical protein [Chloroflexota bacterium]
MKAQAWQVSSTGHRTLREDRDDLAICRSHDRVIHAGWTGATVLKLDRLTGARDFTVYGAVKLQVCPA